LEIHDLQPLFSDQMCKYLQSCVTLLTARESICENCIVFSTTQ